jgi:hypothetical protein
VSSAPFLLFGKAHNRRLHGECVMSTQFPHLPSSVVQYIRCVFAAANDKVSRALCAQPSIHEESLDHSLVSELSACPSAFFESERMVVSLQSHWLGSRRMFGRWEIADVAFFIVLRHHGKLVSRKVALLQTKRLYSREIPVEELDEFDYMVGIGRIVDQGLNIASHPHQRRFSFDEDSKYEALIEGSRQKSNIESYAARMGIPVYYGFYNPLVVPFEALHPPLNGKPPEGVNELGMRVLPATIVHKLLSSLSDGQSLALKELKTKEVCASDPNSAHGWRLETFIADEVLTCREGKLFTDHSDSNLRTLLYERSAPITGAISITIDVLDD